MKKMLFPAAAALVWAACTSGPKDGFTITGTVEGAADGEIVYLESIDNMYATRRDSAVVSKGTFSFRGRQDSAALHYLSCLTDSSAFSTPFFLENGAIAVSLRDGDESVTGTPANDIYQGIRSQISAVMRESDAVSRRMEDSTLTAEQRARCTKMLDSLDLRYNEIQREGMRRNMDNPVGLYLFELGFYENSLSENLALFDKIPARYLTDSTLLGIKGMLDRQKATDVQAPYKDFAMQTPDGKEVRLSDYVGKGKYVLVDFWASWCGPCRQAMPELKKAYSENKQRLEVVGVSFDDSGQAWKDAIEELGLPWPQMSDLKGWKSEAAGLYGVSAIPHTLLIDLQGTIVARNLEPREVAAKLAGLQ